VIACFVIGSLAVATSIVGLVKRDSIARFNARSQSNSPLGREVARASTPGTVATVAVFGIVVGVLTLGTGVMVAFGVIG
jgi:hypothetical protein